MRISRFQIWVLGNRWLVVWLLASIVPAVPFTIPLFNKALSDSPTAYLLWIPLLAFAWGWWNLRSTVGTSDLTRHRWMAAGPTVCVIVVMGWIVGAYWFGDRFFQYDVGLLLWGLWSTGLAVSLWGWTSLLAIRLPMLYLLGGWPPLYITLINWANPPLRRVAVDVLNQVGTMASWIHWVQSDVFSVVSHHGVPTLVEISYGCSGSDSILALLVLFPILFVILQGSLWRKWLLLFFSCVAAFALNLARIVLIVIALHWIGYRFAFDIVHPLLGTVFFILIILVVVMVGTKTPHVQLLTSAEVSRVLSMRIAGVCVVAAIIATVGLSPFYVSSIGTPIRPLLLDSVVLPSLFPDVVGYRRSPAPSSEIKGTVERYISDAGGHSITVMLRLTNSRAEDASGIPAIPISRVQILPGIVVSRWTTTSRRVVSDYTLSASYLRRPIFLHVRVNVPEVKALVFNSVFLRQLTRQDNQPTSY